MLDSHLGKVKRFGLKAIGYMTCFANFTLKIMLQHRSKFFRKSTIALIFYEIWFKTFSNRKRKENLCWEYKN